MKKHNAIKALEFDTKIKNNQIQIPKKIQSEFNLVVQKKVKVIVLMNEADNYAHWVLKQMATEQFLKGYADRDAIYDEVAND